jgi:hypothetical protein
VHPIPWEEEEEEEEEKAVNDELEELEEAELGLPHPSGATRTASSLPVDAEGTLVSGSPRTQRPCKP